MALPTRTALALSVVTALALTACTGDPEPAPTAKPPSTTTATATPAPPTTTTPTSTSTTAAAEAVLAKIPAAARPNTQAGAEAFAKYFYAQVAKSWVTADPSLLAGLYAPGCKTCQQLIGTAEYLHRNKQHFDTVPLTVASSSANSFTEGRAIVALVVIEGDSSIVDRQGIRVRNVPPAGKSTLVVTLTHSGHWRIEKSQIEKLR